MERYRRGMRRVKRKEREVKDGGSETWGYAATIWFKVATELRSPGTKHPDMSMLAYSAATMAIDL